MTALINHKIFNQSEQESLVSTAKGEKKSFTDIISEKIMQYKGKAESELYQEFEVNPKAKGKNSTLIRKMLGLTGDLDKTQEFQKANLSLRVIRVDKNGQPKEDSPFKTYKFKELAGNEEWEESEPYVGICNKRFLFVIFKETEKNIFVLDRIKFWGLPDRLIDEVKRVWIETKDIINNGVQLTQTSRGISTNFPQSKVNNVVFTKLHAQNTYYELEPNVFVGKGKLSDTDELPDGRHIIKHSFWFPKKLLKEVFNGEWE